MVFAAGFGTRMRPLSEWLAKPAMPVAGNPLVCYALAALARAGVTEIAVNLHHRPDDVRAAVAPFEGMTLELALETPKILGTGGGLHNVKNFLTSGDEPFVVINGDTLIEVDLAAAIARHRETGGIATMVLREDERWKDFGGIGTDKLGRVWDFVGRSPVPDGVELRQALFTGVHIFDPSIFEFIPAGFSGLGVGAYPLALRAGRPVWSFFQSGYWSDVGTVARYLGANFDVMNGHAPTLALEPHGVTWNPETQVLQGENVQLDAGADLERCVVWPDTFVPAGEYRDMVVVKTGDGEGGTSSVPAQ